MPPGCGYTGRTGDFFRGNADPDPAPFQKFSSLDQVITDYLLPEYQRSGGNQSELEKLFLQRLNTPTDFGAYRDELSGFAESVSNELFAPGGQVEQAYRGALGQSTESGFGTSSGGVTNAQQNILRGARDVLSNSIAQGAIDLAGVAEQRRTGDIAALLDSSQGAANRRLSLLESLFGAQAGVEQLGLSRESLDLNRRMIESALRRQQGGGGIGGFLGRVGGALLGSALGPIGTAAGGAIGGHVAGLFGGGDDDASGELYPNPYIF